MKGFAPVLIVTLLLSVGCDTTYGVSRRARVSALPNLSQVKARIETYPEIDEVKFEKRVGSRPLTLSGIKSADEVFSLSYSGNPAVRGTLMFERNYKGEVRYHQSFLSLNRKPSQEFIDATWPVMKKIEADLERVFGLRDLRASLVVRISGVDDPERQKPNQAPELTAGSGIGSP
jgi:hypothetical protein